MKTIIAFFKQLGLAIIGLITMTSLVQAQLTNDEVSVLELAFHQIDMQEQDHLNNQQIAVLVIVDNGVLNDAVNLTWFDNPVELQTMQHIENNDTNAYLVFDSFSMNGNKAVVGLSYVNNTADDVEHYIFQLIKNDQTWSVVQ